MFGFSWPWRISFVIVLFGLIVPLLLNRNTNDTAHRSPLPASFIDASLAKFNYRRVANRWSMEGDDARRLEKTADTTAVILNWSRLPNVKRIVRSLCLSLLDDTIANIYVWNNNPSKLSKDDFQADCSKLRIFNSPANLYFEARYLACAEATTAFCYIQDDDYLVLPEIVQALALRSVESETAIYLQPPTEALSSRLKTIRVEPRIHSGFAWLGFGAVIPKQQAQDFLKLMQYLKVSNEELRMSDNYFSLFANTPPHIWFDQGIELGGGEAFTQGKEGDDWNNRHILRAAEYLDMMLNCADPPCTGDSVPPFVSVEDQAVPSMYRAPCVGAPCVLETSVAIVPIAQIDVSNATDILENEERNRKSLSVQDTYDFLMHPPSHAVDGNPDTAFCMPKGVKDGDVIRIDLLGPIQFNATRAALEIAVLVDRSAEAFLQTATVQFLSGDQWVKSDTEFTCAPIRQGELSNFRECSVPSPISVFAFQLVFQREMGQRWCMQEIWARERFVYTP